MGQKIWWYNHTVKKFYRCCTTSDQIRDRVGQWEASLPMKEELWLRDTNLFKLAWEIQTSQDIYTTMCPSYNLKHYNQSDRCFQYNQESTGSPSSSRSKRPVYQSNFDHNTNGSTAVVINLFFHYTIHNRQGGEWLRRSAQNGGTTAVNQFYWGCNTSDRNLATRSNPCLVDLFSLSFPFFSFFFFS
jgi:hypothetical protein